MPSPFPGMDPFLESQWWNDFHHRFIPELADTLSARIRPQYVTIIEEHVYLAHEAEDGNSVRIPDVSVLRSESGPHERSADAELSNEQTGTTVVPAVRTLSMPELTREIYLTIRERQSLRVVTVVELLSPTNKQGRGRREYLGKRAEILDSLSHLVEIDLLRGGIRLETTEPLPPGDHYALIGRQERLPEVDVYAWSLRQPLPRIPIPLAEDDSDVWLDLQKAFTAVYDRAGYDLLLDYEAEIRPALRGDDAEWVSNILETDCDGATPNEEGSA